AGNRFAGVDARAGILLRYHRAQLADHGIGRGFGADGLWQADLVRAVVAERLDARFPDSEAVDAGPQVVDAHGPRKLRPHHLAANEVNSEVESPIGGVGK